MSSSRRAAWTDELARDLAGELRGRGSAGSSRKSRAHQKASAQKTASQDPLVWAHRAEDRVNGLLQQVVQNLGVQHPLHAILSRASEELSDYIFGAGSSENSGGHFRS